MNEEQDKVPASEGQDDAGVDTANEGTGKSVEELEAELAKTREIADNQRIRAEKAEKAAKATKPAAQPAPSPKADDISATDIYALMEAKVPQEDIQDVKEYAKFKGISVADALKSNVVKNLLAEKAEARNVAAATNTGTQPRGASLTSDDALLSNASKGQLPDSDDDLTRMLKARKGIKT